MDISGKRGPKRKYKGPEAEMCSVCLKRKETSGSRGVCKRENSKRGDSDLIGICIVKELCRSFGNDFADALISKVHPTFRNVHQHYFGT